MSKALLICNGAPLPARTLKNLAKEADFVLAADGGADAALAAGLRPNAVIGDLDSVSPRARKAFKDVPFIYVARQDNTDFEKALDWLVLQKFDECAVAGATGKRLDFTLGNFLSVYPYLRHLRVTFQGNGWTLRPLTKGLTFHARKGARMSVIALSDCQGLSLRGVKYRLSNVNWRLGQTGLSNVITAQKSVISFSKGYVLLYVED